MTANSDLGAVDPESACGQFSLLFVLEPISELRKLSKCPGSSTDDSQTKAKTDEDLKKQLPPTRIVVPEAGSEVFGEYVFSSKYMRAQVATGSDGGEHELDSSLYSLGGGGHHGNVRSSSAESLPPTTSVLSATTFRHRIELLIGDADEHARAQSRRDNHLTRIQSVIGYNFLLNDFQIFIRNASDQSVLVRQPCPRCI